MSTQTYPLFVIGNPLLDIVVPNGDEILKKYELNANDAILAEEKHKSMCVFSVHPDDRASDPCAATTMRSKPPRLHTLPEVLARTLHEEPR